MENNEIIKKWKELGIDRGEFQFSCGSDSMGDTDLYFFKKSHAVAYAHAIVVQLNALCEQAEQNDA